LAVVALGSNKRVIKLLELGAKPSARDPEGLIPLHYAAINGDVKIIEMLLKRKAVNWKGHNSTSLLYLAAINGYIKAVRVITNT
jgi:ankyrin repeat protein